MEYNFRAIEKKWQDEWIKTDAYAVPNDSSKPKYYVLDMFPYPSGAGLHVGHPLGYIASDIYARYKRLKGFNVLHPMGYDAFGLPAEQYAIEHGVHPAESTAKNIATFRGQLDKIGFSFDWSRQVNTSDPKYYKWTQWIFLQLFKSWYNRKANKTEHIDGLIKMFEQEGNAAHPIPNTQFLIPVTGNRQPAAGNVFTAGEWGSFDEATKQTVLMEYRIAYCGYGEVNWCEALGTVLANDEVVNGVSERGGYPVVKKKLRQWYLRITEYADRLLQGLQTVDFSEAMKEMQSNWIGKSQGAEIEFLVAKASPPTPLLAERGAEPDSTINLHGEEKESGHHFQTADITNRRTLKAYGRENRRHQTEAEGKLWQRIRNNKLGVKVRRQHNITGFIVDFAVLEAKIAIEIDGGYHDDPEQAALDYARQLNLEQHDYTVLRFTNEDVLTNIEDVLKKIKSRIAEAKTTSVLSDTAPLSARRGVGGEAFLSVYTTRPDTIFGVDFMVVAPEHELIPSVTTPEQKAAVDDYIAYVKSRSERERMAEKKISGVFTGAYAVNPFDGRQIPVWISEYVLAGYGTGAIMAVPSGDERDFKFARHFNIPITNILGDAYNGEEANPTKDAVLSNSGFLDGTVMRDAIDVVIDKLEAMGIGKRKVNYKMRDAAFSRQRYWGEPFPIKWIDGIAYPLDESELPLELPHVESYKPGPEGEGPLANISDWKYQEVKLDLSEATSPLSARRGAGGEALETNTMPGYAGSSWYFLRYMDPHNDATFCDKSVSSYWKQVDLYVGGTEHAVGHLLYSRMWTKALYDLGLITFDEPFKKLLNQGMIQGTSQLIHQAYRTHASCSGTDEEWQDILNHPELHNHFVSFDAIDYFVENISFWPAPMHRHIDIGVTDGSKLDVNKFLEKYPEFKGYKFYCLGGYWQDGKFYREREGSDVFLTRPEVEKMSKSKYNVINPDDIVERFGTDTFRMYEMFLGPIDQSKPWDTKGIEGVHRFLKKLWRLFFDDSSTSPLSARRGVGGEATPAELKALHRTIKKIEEDTERFSYNTAVSAFMVCVNELTDLKCHKKEVLEQLLVLLTPYAPHISEELWHQLGNTSSILDAPYPTYNETYLKETTKEYPVSINGRMRTTMMLELSASQEQVQELVLANPVVQKWTEGKPVKKFIYVQNKMVNVVV